MFDNILRYYPEGNAVYTMSLDIKAYYDKLWYEAMSRFGVTNTNQNTAV